MDNLRDKFEEVRGEAEKQILDLAGPENIDKFRFSGNVSLPDAEDFNVGPDANPDGNPDGLVQSVLNLPAVRNTFNSFIDPLQTPGSSEPVLSIEGDQSELSVDVSDIPAVRKELPGIVGDVIVKPFANPWLATLDVNVAVEGRVEVTPYNGDKVTFENRIDVKTDVQVDGSDFYVEGQTEILGFDVTRQEQPLPDRRNFSFTVNDLKIGDALKDTPQTPASSTDSDDILYSSMDYSEPKDPLADVFFDPTDNTDWKPGKRLEVELSPTGHLKGEANIEIVHTTNIRVPEKDFKDYAEYGKDGALYKADIRGVVSVYNPGSGTDRLKVFAGVTDLGIQVNADEALRLATASEHSQIQESVRLARDNTGREGRAQMRLLGENIEVTPGALNETERSLAGRITGEDGLADKSYVRLLREKVGETPDAVNRIENLTVTANDKRSLSGNEVAMLESGLNVIRENRGEEPVSVTGELTPETLAFSQTIDPRTAERDTRLALNLLHEGDDRPFNRDGRLSEAERGAAQRVTGNDSFFTTDVAENLPDAVRQSPTARNKVEDLANRARNGAPLTPDEGKLLQFGINADRVRETPLNKTQQPIAVDGTIGRQTLAAIDDRNIPVSPETPGALPDVNEQPVQWVEKEPPAPSETPEAPPIAQTETPPPPPPEPKQPIAVNTPPIAPSQSPS